MNKAYVYVVRCSETELFKIGTTKSIKRREKELQSQSAFPLCLCFLFTCPIDTGLIFEKILHQKFSHKRTHGEWYKLDEDDLEFFYGPKILSIHLENCLLTAWKDEILKEAESTDRKFMRDSKRWLLSKDESRDF